MTCRDCQGHPERMPDHSDPNQGIAFGIILTRYRCVSCGAIQDTVTEIDSFTPERAA